MKKNASFEAFILISHPSRYSRGWGNKGGWSNNDCYSVLRSSQEPYSSGGEGVVAGYFNQVAGIVYSENPNVMSAAYLESVDAAI